MPNSFSGIGGWEAIDADWRDSKQGITNSISNLNNSIGIIKDGGVLTDAATIEITNNSLSTLSTSRSTLTLNVTTDGIPNFAVEIMPTVNCTLTVQKTEGNVVTTLSPSIAGGVLLEANKKYQVTCVGSCWTIAEFEVPV